MAILSIARMGHPVLRGIAERVEDPTDPNIARLAADMRDTLEHIAAMGIAAPQVYVSKRVVVYHLPEERIPEDLDLEPIPWTTMVNPEITPVSEDKHPVWERCLSIPGLHGKVPRYKRITIRYQNLAGEVVETEAHGSWASLLQHECDHLDGVLYPIRMEDMSLLSFNDAPGALAKEAVQHPERIDPKFLEMVRQWPNREHWLSVG